MPDMTYAYLPNPSIPAWWQMDEKPEPHIQDLLDFAQDIDSQGQHLDYSQAITTIKKGLLNWVNVGITAFQIKVKKLYQENYLSFQEFCEKELGLSHWRINNYIKAARVIIELAQAGFKTLPNCEAQCQPLTKFYGEELIDKWQTVLDSVEPHKITKNVIEEILELSNGTKASIKLSREIADKLRKKAKNKGLSLDELINQVLEEDDEVEQITEELQENWEEDLNNLVEENQQKEEETNSEIKRVTWTYSKIVEHLINTYNVLYNQLFSNDKMSYLMAYLQGLKVEE